MGKHSISGTEAVKTAHEKSGEFVAGGRREARARASAVTASEPTTATGVLKVVRRRPVLSAIAVPLAAGALVFGGSVAATGGNDDSTVTAATSGDEAVAVPTGDAPEISTDSEFAAKQAAKAKKKTKKSDKGTVSLATPGSHDSSDGSSSGSVPDGVSYPECNKSQSVEKHFATNAKKVYRAVCARFPQVSSYGGYRNDPGSDHGTGHAVDIMISSSVGDDIRDYAIKNHSKLGVKYVIWQQKIYASYTGWNGRPMEDRGSTTANHYDHVHVSVN